MANNIAFQPMGKTVLLSCTSSSANVAVTADSPVNQLYIVNASGNAAFINVSSTSNVSAAVANATTAQYGLCIPANGTKVISTLQSWSTNIYIAGITSTGTASLYVTPGEGL